MRTTLDLDDDLLRLAKAHAALVGTTLTGVIEEGIDRVLEASMPPGQATTLRTYSPPKGTPRGLLPGVDLDDNSALLGLMDADV